MHSVLPALKTSDHIICNAEVGSVVIVFPFQQELMHGTLSVTWSLDIGTCVGAVLEMDVIVTCFGLTDVEYTVTIVITLIINGAMLPGSFSHSFTPANPPLPSSTVSGLGL